MTYSCAIDIQLFVPKTGVYCLSLLNNSTLWGDLSYYIRGHVRPQQMINIDKPYCMYLNLDAGDVVEISGILDGVQKETKLIVDESIYCFTYNLYAFVKINDISTTQLMYTDDFLKLHCSHDWKEYIGFIERYKYCTKCDSKE